MARENRIEGMEELERAIAGLGKVPQNAVTKAARSGANIALKAARAKSPIDTGNLKKGIILKGERRSVPGKKVYDVEIDPAMNDVFVKVSKAGKRSYYPASQEYGFFARDGSYIPGFHYLKNSIEDNAEVIENRIIEVFSQEIDKQIGKG